MRRPDAKAKVAGYRLPSKWMKNGCELPISEASVVLTSIANKRAPKAVVEVTQRKQK